MDLNIPKEGEIRFTDYGSKAHVWRNGNWEPYTPQKDVVVIDLLDDLQGGNRTMEVLKQITAEEARPKVGASIPGSMMSSTHMFLSSAPVSGRSEKFEIDREAMREEVRQMQRELERRRQAHALEEARKHPILPPEPPQHNHVQPFGDFVLDSVEQFERQRRAAEQGLHELDPGSFNLTALFNKLRGM